MFARFAAVAALVVAGLLVVFTAVFATLAQAQTTLSVEFQANEFYELPQGTNPSRVLTGDFNKDGRPDVSYIVASSNPARFSVQYGQADGILSAPISETFGVNSLVEYFKGDFNKDGADDLLFIGFSTYRVMFGQAGSGFISGTLRSISGFSADGGVTGDFNNDTNMDFVIFARTNTSNIRSYFLVSGSESGIFTQTDVYSYNYGSPKLTAADFDNDGNLDIANQSVNGQGIEILYGNGVGNFVTQIVTGSAVPLTRTVAGDINSDGKTDLVSLHSSGGASPVYSMAVYLNQGNREFNTQVISVGKGAPNLIALDLNKDNKLDIAVVYNITGLSPSGQQFYEGKVAVYFNDGNGNLSPPEVFYDAGLNPTSVATTDFNGDTLPDLALTSSRIDGITVIPGLSDGKFKAAHLYPANRRARNVQTTDVNGDGIGDIVVAENNAIQVQFGTASGVLTVPEYYSMNFIQSVQTGDLNADTKPDIAAVTTSGLLGIFLNNGDGSFEMPVLHPVGYNGVGSFGLVLGDFTGDGALDVVRFAEFSSGMDFFKNDGTGVFTLTDIYTDSEQFRYEMAKADLNGDGKLDLLYTSGTNSYVTAFLGNGNALFSNPITFSVGVSPARGVRVADLNGDSEPDLVVRTGYLYNSNPVASTSYFTTEVAALLNTGNGAFTVAQILTLAHLMSAINLGDVDGDGKIDLVNGNNFIANSSPPMPKSYLWVRKGNGDGTFAPEQKFIFTPGTYWSELGDLNGDGNLDLAIVANRGVGDNSPLAIALNLSETPRRASKLDLEAPQTAIALVPFSLTLKALLPDDTLASTYMGAVKLEGVPGLPVSYLFEAADAGKHTFYLKLPAGVYTLTATSAISPQMSVSRIITVVARSVGSNPATGATINVGSSPIGLPISTTLVVSNTGSTPVVVNSASFSGTHAAEFTVTGATFPLTLPNSGDSRELNITCTPAKKGIRTVTLQLTTDALGQPILIYEVSCSGQLLVVKSGDDGTGNEPGTLSYYLVSNRLSAGDTLQFGISGTLTITGTLPVVPSGVTLAGGSACATPVMLDGSSVGGAAGLRLAGGVTLQNIVVSKFPGVQLTTTGTGNRLECIRAVSR